MFIESFFMLVISLLSLILGKSERDVSQRLRDQIVNMTDDLVKGIAPGYISPDSFNPVDYEKAIYEHVYKSLWREFGKSRSEYATYRYEVLDFLREVPSKKFVDVLGYLLQEVSWIVHIQVTDFEKWVRSPSVREKHIKFFKDSVDEINDKLRQNKSKYFYNLEGASVQLVRLDKGSVQLVKLDKGEERSIQENDDNQTAEHHQKQSRNEPWYRKNHIITGTGIVVAILTLIIAILVFLFGDGILKP